VVNDSSVPPGKVSVKGADFAWDEKPETEPVLKNISFDAAPGKLTMVRRLPV
jgi:hypothetical protein